MWFRGGTPEQFDKRKRGSSASSGVVDKQMRLRRHETCSSVLGGKRLRNVGVLRWVQFRSDWDERGSLATTAHDHPSSDLAKAGYRLQEIKKHARP